MKTPEEIKKGLECYITYNTGHCEGISCRVCPHFDPNSSYTITACKDALAYIQQLERERDAAVEDLRTGVCCETCAHYNTDAKEPPCATCRDAYAHGNWQWRGVPQEGKT